MDSWLRFANLQLIPRTANLLLQKFGTPEALFAASPHMLGTIPELTEKIVARLTDPSFIPTKTQLRYLERARVQLVVRGSDDYPRNLAEIPDPPPVLFVRGTLRESDRFAVALVGSRHATPYGKSVAARLATDLAQAGITIVSGGAVGIDTAAHEAARKTGGRTLVVLGCGLDIPYPPDNQPLFEAIVQEEQGALLTEFPLGTQPEHWRFPMRNRLISGLSMGVVVVEAGARSGALITAGIATEQGREVMAVPGNVDRPSCKGTNSLIKDGATLVEDAQDVLQALGILTLHAPSSAPRAAPTEAKNLPDIQRRLLECLSLTPKHIDALAADVHMSSAEVSGQMTLLELSGLVRRLPGNCFIRVL